MQGVVDRLVDFGYTAFGLIGAGIGIVMLVGMGLVILCVLIVLVVGIPVGIWIYNDAGW